MASKRKVNLDDYQLTTTLGTGKLFFSFYFYNKWFANWATYILCSDSWLQLTFLLMYRFIWKSDAGQKQKIRRVLRNETFEESRYHQAATGRSRYFWEHHLSWYRSSIFGKYTYSFSLTPQICRLVSKVFLRTQGFSTSSWNILPVVSYSHI